MYKKGYLRHSRSCPFGVLRFGSGGGGWLRRRHRPRGRFLPCVQKVKRGFTFRPALGCKWREGTRGGRRGRGPCIHTPPPPDKCRRPARARLVSGGHPVPPCWSQEIAHGRKPLGYSEGGFLPHEEGRRPLLLGLSKAGGGSPLGERKESPSLVTFGFRSGWRCLQEGDGESALGPPTHTAHTHRCLSHCGGTSLGLLSQKQPKPSSLTPPATRRAPPQGLQPALQRVNCLPGRQVEGP